MPVTKFTDGMREMFLAHLREVPNIARACRLIGIQSKSIYKRLEKDNDDAVNLREDMDDALRCGVQRMEEEAHRRAFLGDNKPLVHQGEFTYQRDHTAINPATGQHYPPGEAPFKRDEEGNPIPCTVKVYSDMLTIAMLKAHAPEKYREQVDMNVKGELDIAATIAEARRRSTPKSDDGLDDLC